MKKFTRMILERKSATRVLRPLFLLFSLAFVGGVANAQDDQAPQTFSFLNINYKVVSTKDSTVEVAPKQGYRGMLTIPDTVQYNNGAWTVIGIGEAAFAYQTAGTINLPKTLKYIGKQAFYGCGVLQMNLPEGLDSIGDGGFMGCTNLTKIDIPASVKTIGVQAFYGCRKLANVNVAEGNANYSSLDGVLFNKDQSNLIFFPLSRTGNYTIPSTVKIITNNAFESSGITGVDIPEGVETIGANAFVSTKLQSVTIPSTVKGALNGTFSFCSNLASATINSNQITEIGPMCFYPDSKLSTVNIPTSVKTIGRSAFANCTALSDIVIPDGVDSIGTMAFSMDYNLRSLNLPTSVRCIGDQAFEVCGFSEFTVPEGVDSIGTRVFERCTSLTSINFPSTISKIGPNLFYRDTQLATINLADNNPYFTSRQGVVYDAALTKLVMTPPAYKGAIDVPEGVTEIGKAGVRACANVTSVTLPQSLKTISEEAFYEDRGLKQITLPASVDSISWNAFYNTSLDTIYCYIKTPPTIGSYTFQGVGAYNEGKVLYVPRESVDAYKAANYWKTWHSILPIEDVTNGITGIKADDATSAAGGRYFNLSGVEVPADTKGILIHNGKKILVK